MTPHRVWNHRRSAYTLVEMLIVVTIMIMLVAAALPMAKKVMDGSQTREASRSCSGLRRYDAHSSLRRESECADSSRPFLRLARC